LSTAISCFYSILLQQEARVYVRVRLLLINKYRIVDIARAHESAAVQLSVVADFNKDARNKVPASLSRASNKYTHEKVLLAQSSADWYGL
jgi:hypothetical protein